MKMCMHHWEMLRKRINEEGIGGWVAQSGETAVAQLADQANRNEITPVNFDPLMAAHNMIFTNAVEFVGLALFALDEDGKERCPICYLNTMRTEDGRCKCNNPDCQAKASDSIEDFDIWIEHAVLGAKAYMIEQGWI